MAQLDDDETRDAEEIERTKEAWLTAGSFIRVEVAEGCDFDDGKGDSWPVTCTKLDATDRALCALKRQPDFGKVMRAARQALRTLKLRRSFTPEDMGAPWGASAIAAVVGYKDDGTIEGMIWAQKRLRWLQELEWNYGGSAEMRCGLDRTLGAQNCLVHVVAHVEGKDADRGEGSAFEAMLIATGFKHACQCPMRGVGETGLQVWAPGPLKTVLADPQHDLHKFARAGIAPPLTTPQSSEERSKSTKEGMANMGPDARKRQAAGQEKGRAKHGVGACGQENWSTKKKAAQLARYHGYPYFLFIAEALECIRDKRDPAAWARSKLTKARLKRVADAGLAQFEFWTVLPTEEKKGVQGFDIEEFLVVKPDGILSTHVSDYQIETQRGPFPPYDVAVALGLFRATERPPKLPWGAPRYAPAAVNALIARAVAWSSVPLPCATVPPTRRLGDAAADTERKRSSRLGSGRRHECKTATLPNGQ